jgi:hypothetical protein
VGIGVWVGVTPGDLLTDGKYIVLAVNIKAITTRVNIITNNFRCDMIFSIAVRLGGEFPVW